MTVTQTAEFRVEVFVEGEWTGNAVRYGTLKEAWNAGDHLMARWFLPTDMRIMHGDDPFPWAVYSCSGCGPYVAGHMAPSHRGSINCESGSLASGGTYAHCSCDSCY